MKCRFPCLCLALVAALISAPAAPAADEPAFTRQEDVIYGRKHGTALTMDIFKPKREANGAAIVLAVSGGFFSSHEAINPAFVLPLIDRGYTVFTVVHGSQPRYTVPEIVADMNRAVRFIRHHAADYGIDADRIGVTGASAGGHLSLMLGTAGGKGDPNAKDPVDRESSRVQAVACFFPPTDLLNWGKPGKEMLYATDHDPKYRPAFDHRERDEKTALWVPVTDPERLRQIAHQISPIDYVTADDPPTLMIHGDADRVVPIQQSLTMAEALKKAGVETKLVVKEGAGHGWLNMLGDINQIVDWFDSHLKKPGASHDAKRP
jgi:acetyl esterase/lipase